MLGITPARYPGHRGPASAASATTRPGQAFPAHRARATHPAGRTRGRRGRAGVRAWTGGDGRRRAGGARPVGHTGAMSAPTPPARGSRDLLGGPPATLLPDDLEAPAARALEQGQDAAEVAARTPAASLPWAVLAEDALADGEVVQAYAYARTGYHRGLDALRRAGWRGAGPVPYAHEPNRGFLRALAALARAAAAVGEGDEADRCAGFLADCDAQAPVELLPQR